MKKDRKVEYFTILPIAQFFMHAVTQYPQMMVSDIPRKRAKQ